MGVFVAAAKPRSIIVTAVKRVPPASCPRCMAAGAFVEYRDSVAHCKFCSEDIDTSVASIALGTLGYWHRNPLRRIAHALARAFPR